MKTNKIIMLLTFFMFLPVITSCSVDKDKNGKDDRVESQGIYWINVPGKEEQRNESITITNVKDDKHGTISGSVYSKTVDKVFYFISQDVTFSEYEGNIWYTNVRCTDGVIRRIFFRRTGIGNYVSSGSVNLGAEVLGNGGSAGYSWTYTVYNEYGRITYCIYDTYNYLK